MTITEKVQSVLETASGVTSRAPADRIKMPGDWQGLARPYLVHFPVTPEPTHIYGGRARRTFWDYQLSAFGSTYAQAEGLCFAARDALEVAFGACITWTGGPAPGPNDPLVRDVVHVLMSFRIAEAL